jgi:phage-related protein
MEEPHHLKRVIWIGSSRKDLKSFPDEVRDFVGHVLYQAQMGAKDRAAKPLLGFGGTGVIEIIKDYHTDTYRAVYTLKFDDIIYVLHAFQKKSKHGIVTPKSDMALIKARLKLAEKDYRLRQLGESRKK